LLVRYYVIFLNR